jgi:hypothetical protein
VDILLGMADGEQHDPETGEVQWTAEPGDNVYVRINAVMRRVRDVRKVRKHEAHRFRFSGHEDVTEAVRDAMVDCGLVAVPNVVRWVRAGTLLSCDVEVAYVNIHSPEDRFVVLVLGESFSQDKNKQTGEMQPSDTQAGKALSYAVKMAHLKTFMLLGDSTEDNEASPAQAQSAQQAAVEPISDSDFMDLARGFTTATDREAFEKARAQASAMSKRLNSAQLKQLSELFGETMKRLEIK